MIHARGGEVACEIVLEPATHPFVDALPARGAPAIENRKIPALASGSR